MSNGLRLGLFFTIIRPEEKAILAAAEARGVAVERWDDGEVTFGLDRPAHLLKSARGSGGTGNAGRCAVFAEDGAQR